MRITKMNEKTPQVIDVGDIIKKVGDLPEYLQFINNACLIEFIKQSFKDARKYDSFFLKNEDGKVKELCHTLLHMPIELIMHTNKNIRET
jgi:thioredoxin-related protein